MSDSIKHITNDQIKNLIADMDFYQWVTVLNQMSIQLKEHAEDEFTGQALDLAIDWADEILKAADDLCLASGGDFTGAPNPSRF